MTLLLVEVFHSLFRYCYSFLPPDFDYYVVPKYTVLVVVDDHYGDCWRIIVVVVICNLLLWWNCCYLPFIYSRCDLGIYWLFGVVKCGPLRWYAFIRRCWYLPGWLRFGAIYCCNLTNGILPVPIIVLSLFPVDLIVVTILTVLGCVDLFCYTGRWGIVDTVFGDCLLHCLALHSVISALVHDCGGMLLILERVVDTYLRPFCYRYYGDGRTIVVLLMGGVDGGGVLHSLVMIFGWWLLLVIIHVLTVNIDWPDRFIFLLRAEWMTDSYCRLLYCDYVLLRCLVIWWSAVVQFVDWYSRWSALFYWAIFLRIWSIPVLLHVPLYRLLLRTFVSNWCCWCWWFVPGWWTCHAVYSFIDMVVVVLFFTLLLFLPVWWLLKFWCYGALSHLRLHLLMWWLVWWISLFCCCVGDWPRSPIRSLLRRYYRNTAVCVANCYCSTVTWWLFIPVTATWCPLYLLFLISVGYYTFLQSLCCWFWFVVLDYSGGCSITFGCLLFCRWKVEFAYSVRVVIRCPTVITYSLVTDVVRFVVNSSVRWCARYPRWCSLFICLRCLLR